MTENVRQIRDTFPWGPAARSSQVPGAIVTPTQRKLLGGQAGRGNRREVCRGSGHRLANGHACYENVRLIRNKGDTSSPLAPLFGFLSGLKQPGQCSENCRKLPASFHATAISQFSS